MFITLRHSSNHPDMEQVVAMGANIAHDPRHGRLSRRPSCINCQKRKLRCTGSEGDCDRCVSRSVTCVFPPSNGRNRQRHALKKNFRTESPKTLSKVDSSEEVISPEPSEKDVGHNLPTPSVSPSESEAVRETLQDTTFYNDVTQLTVDLEALSRNMQLDTFPAAIDPRLQCLDGTSGAFQIVEDVPQVPSDELDLLRVDSLDRSTDLPVQEAIPNFSNNNSLASSPTNPTGESVLWNTPGCLCIYSTVGIMQQLDDEFSINSLTLDQIVQLLKWGIAQCSKPVDCPNCQILLTVDSVLVIICERLVEMFECVSRRLRLVHQRLAEPGIATPESEQSPSDTSDLESFALGLSGGQVSSTPGIFSDEFQTSYSYEEQVYIIRVLLRLQLRKFRALLSRLDGVMQIVGSETQRLKVLVIMQRLNKAAVCIDNSLRVMLQCLS